MKEIFQLPTGRADVYVNANGSSITVNGFKATLMQLRILSMRKDLKPDSVCRKLGIPKGTYDQRLKNLVDTNADDFSDTRPTLDELAEIADKHELLYLISIRGMEALTKDMRNK
jgi:hypothetical protein